jgi:acetyl esterase/lipase
MLLRGLVALVMVSLVSSVAEVRGDDFLNNLEKAGYVEARMVFGTGGGRDLRLDIYPPSEKEGPFPAVVFVHGGGWRAGHPGHFSRQAMYLAANGYVCACIEYRLSGEAPFPAAIEDVKCAVRWLRAEGTKHFSVDPDRIAVSGGSAGGHLALLAATSGGVVELEGAGGWQEYSSNVQCAVAFNPASSFDNFHIKVVQAFMGGTYEDVPGNYRKASPATWLDESDPPVLILHGTEDKTVPYSHSVTFIEKLKEHGVEAELYSEQGEGHTWFSFPPYFVPTTAALKKFLDKHLKN